MKTKYTWKKALIASMIVSFAYTTILIFVSSGGRMYFSPSDYEGLENMSYYEAQDILTEKSKSITRWESLANGVQFTVFWFNALLDWLLSTFICFLSCMLFLRLAQSNKSLSRIGADAAPPG